MPLKVFSRLNLGQIPFPALLSPAATERVPGLFGARGLDDDLSNLGQGPSTPVDRSLTEHHRFKDGSGLRETGFSLQCTSILLRRGSSCPPPVPHFSPILGPFGTTTPL
jgi:hypothetical protein